MSAVLLIVIAVLAGGYLHFGSRSSKTSDETCFDIKRPHYPLRHWSWSGIFPFEGGLIPDPHFLCSEPAPLPDSVRRALGTGNGSFQIIDINPFFYDRSSEIELVIQTSGSLYEYQLQFPKKRGVQAVLSTRDKPAFLFPYKDGLALVADFYGQPRGIYPIPLPLRSGDTLALVTPVNADFDRISRDLKLAAQDVTVRMQFCESQKWPFISYFEKYAEDCGLTTDSDGVKARDRFDEFWKKMD